MDLQQQLDRAIERLKLAMTRAYLCGYVKTVREEQEERIHTAWEQMARKHTR